MAIRKPGADRPATDIPAGRATLNEPRRLTRALVDRLPSRCDERGLVRLTEPDPEYCNRTAAGILTQLEQPETLRIRPPI